HPQLTPDMNLPSQFSWLAYLYLLRFLSELNDNQKDTLFYGKGLIKGLSTPEDQERLAIKDWIHSLSSGVSHNEFKAPHLYFPHAGALNIPQFCQLLIELAGLSDERLFLSTQVNSIEKNGEQWQLLFKQDGENQSKNYQHIILCTGSAFQKPMTNHFDSKTYATHLTRGQSCIINHDDSIPLLKQVLMDQVYLVPQNNGQLHIGATFEPCEQPDSFDLDPLVQRQLLEQANSTLKKFGNDEIADELIKSLTINGNVGYRLHTQDKLPLVGGLIDEIKLKKDFANLGQRKIRNEDLSTYNLPGLWMNSAYGSHGLLYALIASEHLSNTITSGISPINSQLAQAIHPVRFLIKQLLKTGTT
ncbi:MAG: FAD-dependent 5-carboxymethylaminomethyl-2-thiouridine(34) oxidoreductase MnmC, partial [Gammaproteobacteria bacterium]|nr:FAD-dependent 5-carboxymethylaminomethyl-2-thiouridine(34) oxidoreductase MnmC [Gammaproteobacteria bacterium]